MSLRPVNLLFVMLLAILLTGCKEPAQKVSQPRARTAADEYSDMEKIRLSGHLDDALKRARNLVSTYTGTPEADKVVKLIPELEAAIKAKDEAERVRATEAAAAAEAQELAKKWTYISNDDVMTGRKSKHAIILSENTVTFDFPYEGSQHGSLELREHPTHGSDVMFSIERGQLQVTSYSDRMISVRFDSRAPEGWKVVGPADNSTTCLFIKNEALFVEKLRNARIVRIQVPFYQEGERVFEFKIGGFNYTRFKGGI